MKAITLRRIPRDVQNLIEREAHETGLSLNKAVIRLLRRCMEQRREPQGAAPFTDLDHLAGSWSDEEAEEFNRALELRSSTAPWSTGRASTPPIPT